MRLLLALLGALALVFLGQPNAAHAQSAPGDEGLPLTLGFIETAFIGELTLEMSAKLDTGADSSSVYARDVRVFEKSRGDDWVRYRLIGDDGRTIRFEKNIVRYAQIKTKRGGSIRRPVVLLDVCVGGTHGVAEFNLADRDQFDYDVLIGREFLASRVLVDSGRRYTAEGACDAYLEAKNPIVENTVTAQSEAGDQSEPDNGSTGGDQALAEDASEAALE
ncbi:MAG: RimK/LysX family protein [Pseudomonadota bacterium]